MKALLIELLSGSFAMAARLLSSYWIRPVSFCYKVDEYGDIVTYTLSVHKKMCYGTCLGRQTLEEALYLGGLVAQGIVAMKAIEDFLFGSRHFAEF